MQQTHFALAGPLCFALSSTSLAQEAVWRWVDNDSPVSRWTHAAAYDSDRGRMIVFGGPGSEGETWEWDSAARTWSMVSLVGPSNRGHAAMAYDRHRGVTVLTGGGNGASQREVWEWSGSSRQWNRRNDLPNRRAGHAMAYDTARGIIVLYGGAQTAGTERDTLMYDGSSWQSVTTNFPGVQTHHSVAYDAAQGRMILVESNSGGFMDTYAWSTATLDWTPLGIRDQPQDRPNPAIAYDERRERIVLVGGFGNNQTHELDGDAWLLRDQGGALNRDQHTLVYDTQRGQTLLFAGLGANTHPRRDLRAWDGEEWSVLSDTPSPQPRSMWGGLVFDEQRGVTICYGGLGVSSDNRVRNLALEGTWEWDGHRWQSIQTSRSPGPRYGHSVVFDSIHGRALLFGGRTNSRSDRPDVNAELWEYDGTDWAQIQTVGPSARQNHAMAFDARRRKVVLFGGTGEGGTNPNGETWEFDVLARTWSLVTQGGPGPRWSHSMTYDRQRGVVVLFGGSNGTLLNETWEWDGQTWVQLNTAAPSRRVGAAISTDTAGRTVLFGGTGANNVVLGDLWLYQAGAWQQLDQTRRPSTRTRPAACYDSARGRFVMFGGLIGVVNNDLACSQTWELSISCPADFNADGFLDFFDYADFVSCFEGAWCASADPLAADFNADGFIDFFDYSDFVAAFEAGC